MKRRAIIFTVAWLSSQLVVPGIARAEGEPYSTQINITGRETGPYSISATVSSTSQSEPLTDSSNTTGSGKRPYKMDRSRDITNEDLSRVLEPFLNEHGPFPVSGKDLKNYFDAQDKKIEKMKATSHDKEHLDPHAHPSDHVNEHLEPHAHPSDYVNQHLEPHGHPSETEMISDPVPEVVPLNDDERYHQLDLAIARARRDLIEAEDRLARSTNDRDRQQAIRDIEGARQRLQNATNAAP